MVGMISYIFYNNKSSKDLGLIIENTPNIPSAKRIYETVEIDGGETLTKIKGYEDIEISFDFAYTVEQDEYFAKKLVIDSWLLSKVDDYLTYSLDTSASYKVKQLEIGETTTTSRTVRHFKVKFTCKGLRYITSGIRTIPLTSSQVLNNFGIEETKPLIKIYGSGNITFRINSSSFAIKNVSDYVNIDSEIKECFKDNINKGKDMTGDWPVFFIGENTVSWTGTVTKVEITPRWRCY